MPSPHPTGNGQSARQQLGSRPVSQCSSGVQIPFPHTLGLQLASHPSSATKLPSSHVSPGPIRPSPQSVTARWQRVSQASPPSLLPSSHTSPALRTPLPQLVGRQLSSQPSPFPTLPSSQISV